MILEQLIGSLPDHWKVIYPDDNGFDNKFADDGRDYDMPMFVRKDHKARIYFNDGENDTDYMFGIVLEPDDGDCCGDLIEAIAIADAYSNGIRNK